MDKPSDGGSEEMAGLFRYCTATASAGRGQHTPLRVAELHGCRARGRIHVVGGDWCTDGPRAHAVAYAGEHSALDARPDTEGSGEPSAAHMDDEGAQTVTSVAEQRLALALEAAELGTWTWDMESATTIWDARLEALH